MKSNNGGIRGAFLPTTYSSASGRWGRTAAAIRALRNQSQPASYIRGDAETWPDPADASFSSVVAVSRCDTPLIASSFQPVEVVAGGGGTVTSAFASTSSGSIGNAGVSSSFGKFANGSFKTNATAGLVLTPNVVDFAFGTGDFAIEIWFYLTSLGSGNPTLLDFTNNQTGSVSCPTLYFNASSQKMRYYTQGADKITGTTNLSLNAWHYGAYIRTSGTGKMYLDGSQEGSNFTDSVNYTTGGVGIVGIAEVGGVPAGPITGYIGGFRFTKATRSSSVPTSPFPYA